MRFALTGWLLLLIVLASPDLSAQETPGTRIGFVDIARVAEDQLSAEGHAGFELLVTRTAAGALGPGIRRASYTPTHRGMSWDGAVLVELERTDGTDFGILLLRPSGPRTGEHPRQFEMFPGAGVADHDLAAIAAQLDDIFASSPWRAGPTSVPQGLSTVGKTRVIVGFLFIVLTVGLGALFLLLVLPRSAAERLSLGNDVR